MNFTIHPADLPADYPRIAELLNVALPNPVTAAAMAADDAQLPAGSIKAQIVAVDTGGVPVGYASAHRYPNTKAGKFYIALVAVALTFVERLGYVPVSICYDVAKHF